MLELLKEAVTVAVVPLTLHSPDMTVPVPCCIAMHFVAVLGTVAVQVVPDDIAQLVPLPNITVPSAFGSDTW